MNNNNHSNNNNNNKKKKKKKKKNEPYCGIEAKRLMGSGNSNVIACHSEMS